MNIALTPNLGGWQQPGPIVFSVIGQQIQIDPTLHQITVSRRNYWKTTVLQNPCVPISIQHQVRQTVGSYIPIDTVANYPGVPISMNTTLPHLILPLITGNAYCQL